jgi:hypothetical protein
MIRPPSGVRPVDLIVLMLVMNQIIVLMLVLMLVML